MKKIKPHYHPSNPTTPLSPSELPPAAAGSRPEPRPGVPGPALPKLPALQPLDTASSSLFKLGTARQELPGDVCPPRTRRECVWWSREFAFRLPSVCHTLPFPRVYRDAAAGMLGPAVGLLVMLRCRIACGFSLGLGMGLPRKWLHPQWGTPSLSSRRPTFSQHSPF